MPLSWNSRDDCYKMGVTSSLLRHLSIIAGGRAVFQVSKSLSPMLHSDLILYVYAANAITIMPCNVSKIFSLSFFKDNQQKDNVWGTPHAHVSHTHTSGMAHTYTHTHLHTCFWASRPSASLNFLGLFHFVIIGSRDHLSIRGYAIYRNMRTGHRRPRFFKGTEPTCYTRTMPFQEWNFVLFDELFVWCTPVHVLQPYLSRIIITFWRQNISGQ